jgi:hypothetical protein
LLCYFFIIGHFLLVVVVAVEFFFWFFRILIIFLFTFFERGKSEKVGLRRTKKGKVEDGWRERTAAGGEGRGVSQLEHGNSQHTPPEGLGG